VLGDFGFEMPEGTPFGVGFDRKSAYLVLPLSPAGTEGWSRNAWPASSPVDRHDRKGSRSSRTRSHDGWLRTIWMARTGLDPSWTSSRSRCSTRRGSGGLSHYDWAMGMPGGGKHRYVALRPRGSSSEDYLGMSYYQIGSRVERLMSSAG